MGSSSALSRFLDTQQLLNDRMIALRAFPAWGNQQDMTGALRSSSGSSASNAIGVCARSIGGVLGRVWQWFAPAKSAPVLTPENFTERFERALWNMREHHLNTFKEQDDA